MATDRARAQYRAAVAVELRMAGADYDEIARELGFAGRSGAWKAVQRALRLAVDLRLPMLREQIPWIIDR